MAAGEEEIKGEDKGFAGLSLLVSDVDTTLSPPARRVAARSGESSGAEPPAASPHAQPEPQPTQQQPYQAPSQPPSGSSTVKWVLGIATVIGVLWLVDQGNTQPSSPTPAYSPPAQTTAPSYSAAPAQPQTPSRPEESKPPVGQDIVFSTVQVRYCLAEDIRMEGAKSAVNNYIDSDVDRFNAMVVDYNSRCGSFRYRSGALENARRDIEPYRDQLQAEGMSRFVRSPSASSSTATTLSNSSSKTAQSDIETNTRSSFDSLSFDEKDAVETACILKRSEGTASYNNCLTAQLNLLAKAPRQPDLAGLSYDEKDAIETACILKRSEGAASYNRCLTAQLSALAKAPRQPDLSALSYDQKDAIETACSLKRSEGAASYNRCLVAQLRAFGR